MDQSSHEIQRQREQTRAALTEKIELLEECVRDTKNSVKQKFDYRYQTEKQPWKMLGASVAVGFLAGRAIGSAPARHSRAATQSEFYGRPGKNPLKGAVIGAVVPMLVDLVKTVSLRAISSRGDKSTERRGRGEARALTPFRNEQPHAATTLPPRAGDNRAG